MKKYFSILPFLLAAVCYVFYSCSSEEEEYSHLSQKEIVLQRLDAISQKYDIPISVNKGFDFSRADEEYFYQVEEHCRKITMQTRALGESTTSLLTTSLNDPKEPLPENKVFEGTAKGKRDSYYVQIKWHYETVGTDNLDVSVGYSEGNYSHTGQGVMFTFYGGSPKPSFSFNFYITNSSGYTVKFSGTGCDTLLEF